jgi:hypothetical protein
MELPLHTQEQVAQKHARAGYPTETAQERELHTGAHCGSEKFSNGDMLSNGCIGEGVGTGYWRFFRRAPTAVRYGLGQIETTHSWLRIASLLLQMEPNEHRNK